MPTVKNKKDRPNIILILADDMGFSDIGCYGSEIETPNLDKLASHGIRFTQMYNCARCCPSRASLLTGLYPHQAGIGHMVSDMNIEGYRGFLNDNCATIAEVLKENGYKTALSGKWHVGGYYPMSGEYEWNPGSPNKPRPIDRGFDVHYGTLGGAGSYYHPHSLIKNDNFVIPESENFYYTDEISNFAEKYIHDTARSEQPFFLYVAYTAPHWPLHAPEEIIEKYRGKYLKGWDYIRTSRHEELKGKKILDKKWKISSRDESALPWEEIKDKEWWDAKMAVYAAQIDVMDQGIGRIVKALEDNRIKDNTMVIFLSDNGGCAEFLNEDGHKEYVRPYTRDGKKVVVGNDTDVFPGAENTFMSYDLPWANASNSPFRLFKHWAHEGGISTPCIINYPQSDQQDVIRHQTVHFFDIMPTILEIADATFPKERNGKLLKQPEGESFAELIFHDSWNRKDPIIWEHEGNRAVRLLNWKLVSKYPGEWELYDMDEDRTELNDISAKNKEQVKKMVKMYEDISARCGVVPWDSIRKMVGDDFLSR
jgi:arylsulfatase A-like enzyme